MASQKEEPNPSLLFGDSAGDDPFSQIQQQQQQQQQPPSVTSGKRNCTTTANPHEETKNVLGDASSLFDGSNAGGADLFFSSAPPQQQQQQPISQHQHQQPPLTSNASAASFFEQPNPAESFFDGLGQNAQASQPNAAASLTQAYDPSTYSSYDYSQHQQQQPSEQYTQQDVSQDQQQQCNPNQQWIQFDPNQHYYYDEQGQVHYYDPNTNQEYDMSQYGYDQQGQTYDYQYDPQQYAEYYAKHGYDPNTYAAAGTTEATATEQAYTQDNYDPNAYAPVSTQQQNMTAPPPAAANVSSTVATAATTPAATVSSIVDSQQGYYTQQQDEYQQQTDYDYQQQAYAPPSNDNNAVAEVPAQIQSEQTIDTQHYTPQQDQYNASAYDQQHDYSYQSYEGAEDLQQQQQQYAVNQDYSQSNFFAEDLQQQQVAPSSTTNNVVPPPPKTAMAPPRAKSVVSPPPQQQAQAIAPPPKAQQQQEQSSVVDDLFGKEPSIFQNEWLNSEQQPEEAASAPPLSQQPKAVVPTNSVSLSQRGSYDANVPVIAQQESQREASAPVEDNVELDDLDDLVLGGSGSVKETESSKQESAAPAKKDEFNLLMSTADYDAHTKEEDVTEKDHAYNNSNQHEEKPAVEEEIPVSSVATDQQVPVAEEESKQNEVKEKESFSVYEPQQPVAAAIETFASYEPQQQQEQQPVESTYESTAFETQQQGQEQHYGAYDSQQYEQQQPAESYEPYQGEQVVDYSSYQPQQGEQTVNYSPYEPQQGEQAVDYSSYQAQEEAATSYESQQAEQLYTSYEPTSYASQQQSYEPEQVTTSYEPQAQQNGNAYEPQPAETTSFAPPPPQQKQQESYYNNYAPPVQQQLQQQQPPATATNNYAPPAAAAVAPEPPKQFVASPPLAPSRRNMISPPPPSSMQSFSQRSNSITEPDRKQSMSPTASYYNNTTQQSIERSATVPPPMTERIASPRPALIACPDPQCEGENKAKAKFCCECGRPLAGISRSTTPSASLSPTGGYSIHDGFSPMSAAASFAPPPVPVRTALDEKKDVMVESLRNFNSVSVLIHADHQEKQKLALDYIDARVGEFEPSKALLWNIVKLMIQYQDTSVLGDGGELDKSIVALLSTQQHSEETTSLDKLETYLAHGDREGACQFAMENDMWAHALIISQSHNPDHFKRVISQFIKRELVSNSVQLIQQVPGDKKSLCMLYSVFSGAGADAVSELARTSIDEYPTTYTKESLEGWQHGLSFILANRSSKDKEAITGLGDQLKQVGSIYDASICYALSPDSNLESVQVLGAQGSDMYTDLDALYLSELYEFALSSSSTKPSYLQNYKLIHAWWLSELGFTTESQIYCDSIVNALTTTNLETDRSVILQELRQLGENNSLAAPSSDHVLSLLNKTTIDTLIGSIEEKTGSSQNYGGYGAPGYQSYGYDSSAAGYVPTPDYAGQEASSAVAIDNGGQQQQQTGDTYNYGYGYGGSYTDQTADSTTTTEVAGKIQSPFQQQKSVKSVQSPFGAAAAAGHSPAVGGMRSPFQHNAGGAYAQLNTESTSGGGGGWWGASTEEQTDTTTDEAQQQQANVYQPYQPDAYAPPVVASATNTNSGSAAWDDDEDDLGFGNTKKKSIKEETKQDEKFASEAVKEEKPNEKEEKKEEKPASSGGGGWGLFSIFGRGGNKEKDPNSDEKKAVKANLGEQSSFYYDEVEKRWKNKSADLAPPVAATPPPPKVPTTPKPPTASNSPAPPMGSGSPAMGAPPPMKPASMPPSRINSAPNVPSSAAVNGGPPNAAKPSFNTPPPTGRRGAGAGARKPMRSRYVDVLNTNQ